MYDRKIVCASPKYLEKHPAPKTPQELSNHNYIVFGENAVWKFRQQNKKGIIEISEIKGNIKCDNGEIVKELTLAGLE